MKNVSSSRALTKQQLHTLDPLDIPGRFSKAVRFLTGLLRTEIPFLALSLCAVILSACASGVVERQNPEPSVQAAMDAYAKLDLEFSRQLMEQVLGDAEATVTDRVKAQIHLATLDWRFYGNPDSARERLKEAAAAGEQGYEAQMALIRVEMFAKDYEAAWEIAEGALELSETVSERTRVGSVMAQAAYERAKEAMLEPPFGSVDNEQLASAAEILKAILTDEPGALIPSKLLLAIALILEDGPTALGAWHSYFRIPSGQEATGVLEEPHSLLERILPTWRNRLLSPEERVQIALALADSSFYEHAVLLVLDPRIPGTEVKPVDPRFVDVLNYYRFIREVEKVTEDYYRATALGQDRRREFDNLFDLAARDLWNQLHWPEGQPRYSLEGFTEELGSRFTVDVNLGETSGVYDLHMGHRVIDEIRTVEQYGHNATIQFIVLDSMVSNGYESWFWDGERMHGGWGGQDTITQVREAYADEPLEAWGRIGEPAGRDRFGEEVDAKSALDDGLAQRNPYAYLPGLDMRLQLIAYSRLLDSVERRGLIGDQLRLAFMAEYERRLLESSIFAHEGRHVIDARSFLNRFRDGEEKEFRAKLSEVVFATDPVLAMTGGIMNPNIGGDTAHGKANERIMKGIVQWMEEHAGEIDKIDLSRPLLPQLDLLTDEQIQAAFRSMDPLAN